METSRLNLCHRSICGAACMPSLLNDLVWLRFIGDRGVRSLGDTRLSILHLDGDRELKLFAINFDTPDVRPS